MSIAAYVRTCAWVLLQGYGQVQSDPSKAVQSRKPEAVQSRKSGASWRRALQQARAVMVRCPFEAAPLPMSGAAIGLDPHMVTFYAHEASEGGWGC